MKLVAYMRNNMNNHYDELLTSFIFLLSPDWGRNRACVQNDSDRESEGNTHTYTHTHTHTGWWM